MSRKKTAFISVYNKEKLEQFAPRLAKCGFQIISTGNTAKFLSKHGVKTTEVSDYTGFPELFEGRVKTLHPKVHAGILARDSKADLKVLEEQGIVAIDLVVVNLYPFEEKPGIETIDIGGPTLLRAAAKNHERVTVVWDPADYDRVADAFEKSSPSDELRQELAAKVFARTAQYEKAIAEFFNPPLPSGERAGVKGQPLRYGENPHQQALFQPVAGQKLFWKEPLQGKELSYNNIVDADHAFQLLREFQNEPFAATILKHTNPCGVAVSQKSLTDAFEKAFACDSSSAYGGIAIFNREVDEKTAAAMEKIFFEIILAPQFSKKALAIFSKKKSLRLLQTNSLEVLPPVTKSAGGGLLVQDSPEIKENESEWMVKTKRKPTGQEWSALRFAWKIVKHVTSNAIVLATADQLLGAGAGQTSRLDSIKIATMKMQACHAEVVKSEHPEPVEGPIVCASDAFLPFADNVAAIAQAKATAVIQPGGSIRDEEVIAACDKQKIAMVFTGRRYFRH